MLAKTFRSVKQHVYELEWDSRDLSAMVMGRREKESGRVKRIG